MKPTQTFQRPIPIFLAPHPNTIFLHLPHGAKCENSSMTQVLLIFELLLLPSKATTPASDKDDEKKDDGAKSTRYKCQMPNKHKK